MQPHYSVYGCRIANDFGAHLVYGNTKHLSIFTAAMSVAHKFAVD